MSSYDLHLLLSELSASSSKLLATVASHRPSELLRSPNDVRLLMDFFKVNIKSNNFLKSLNFNPTPDGSGAYVTPETLKRYNSNGLK